MKQPEVLESTEPTVSGDTPPDYEARKISKKSHISRYLLVAAVMIVGLVVAALAGSLITYKTGRSLFGAVRAVPVYIADNNQAQEKLPVETFAPIVKSVLPAVVNISSSRVVRQEPSPFPDNPFFRRFFGDQFRVPRERREQSLGSGVIVSPEGYILTNNHVIDSATDVRVVLSDKREFKASIVGADPQTDIAVLRVEASDLPAIAMADSSKVQVGDVELAIGNPFGLGQTVTMGIVSATGRGNLGIEDYEDFIQTDAAINPGNSGGALINTQGELIGINTAIISHGAEGNQGIGFAVPINMARRSMEQILEHGKVIRGWLGISIQDVTASVAKALNLAEPQGALVGDVTPNSPAAKAGIERGDIIIRLNGNVVGDSRLLRLNIADLAPGTTVQLTLLRDGSQREVSVTLGEYPSTQQNAGSTNPDSGPRIGVGIEPLTPEIASQLGISADTRGVVVVEVQPSSPAADAGLRRGDVIEEVNRNPVSSVSEFQQAVSQSGSGPLLLLVNRRGNTAFIVVEAR